MKIAVITDDGKSISVHFGRAPHYLVFTVENKQIVATELRDKAGHRQFAHEDHDCHSHEQDHAHGHAHGHGFGAQADHKHARMIDPIADCQTLLVRGMGRGAYLALLAANILPIVTDIEDAEAAVQAYIDGMIVNHPEGLH